ncbi:EF-hand calcium-binding domain-containing protein 6 [Engraulis encrasicolus]|uniref:EF-hand calcium-binding domain-containing protein 6 n=1 Tax=Engraulis encrasicolus TaxID=184585 RepID=UPI002FD771A6
MYLVGPLHRAEMSEVIPISRGLTLRTRSSQPSLSRGKDRKAGSLRAGSASSVQSTADENLTLEDIERLLAQKVEDKKDDLKAAFQALDQEGNGTVTKMEFRRVIKNFLVPLTQSQFDVLLTKVPMRGNGSVAYMEFLRKYCTFPSNKLSVPNSHGHLQNQAFVDLQHNLKEKIGSNLKNISRAFRLFDYNLDGQLQQQEFRRVLQAYCFPLSDRDFRRLWTHYSASNTDTVFYKDFLKRLGVDCENSHKIPPNSIDQVLNWNMCNLMKTRKTNRRVKSAWGDAGKNEDNFDELLTTFLRKMRVNYSSVQKALRAFDSAGSGVIFPEDLKSVLSSFIFPMNERLFHGLISRFGVQTREPIPWKEFLALFEDGEQCPSGSMPSAPIPGLSTVDRILPKLHHVQEIYTVLQQAFQIFDENKTGLPLTKLWTVAEGLSFPLTDKQFTRLVDLLDPDCTGFVQHNHFIKCFRSHPKSAPMEITGQRCQSATAEMDQAPMSSVTMATWATVETILKDRLSEQLEDVVDALQKLDSTQNGSVSLGDLKRVIHLYGLAVSDNHFEKLCTPFTDCDRVKYKPFLKGLGIQNIAEEDSISTDSVSLYQKSGSAFQAHLAKQKKAILLDVVMKRFRDDLDSRGMSIQDCLKKSWSSPPSILTLAGFSKILDDSMIILDELHFDTLTEALGFRNGQISWSDFVSQFEKNAAKERSCDPEQIKENLKARPSFLNSAEECLKHLKERITEIHGDARTAFGVMDRDRDGLVNWRDFRRLFDSLQFAMREKEYQRLLNLMGLGSHATLNCLEFLDSLHRANQEDQDQEQAKKSCHSLGPACEQIHEQLAMDLGRHWPSISKDLCQFSEDDGSIVQKKSLRQHFYKFPFPVTNKDFEKLWTSFLRYDKEGKGFLTASELFDVLNIKPKGPDPVSESPVTQGEPELGPEQQVAREMSSPPHGCSSAVSQALRSTSQSPPAVEDLSPDRALQRVREIVTVSTDTLHKAFSAFDKEDRGLLSSPEFRRVLDHFCLKLTDRQFSHLLIKLNSQLQEEGMVNWKQFLDTFQFKTETAEEWLEKIEKVHFPSQAQPLPLNAIMGRIKDVVSTRLYVITKEMVARDYAQINVISKESFRNICKRHFMRLTSEQFDNLWNILPVNGGGNLEIREFLKRFSGDVKVFDDQVIQHRQGPTSSPPPPPLPPLLSSVSPRPLLSSVSETNILRRPKTSSCSVRTAEAGEGESSDQTRRPYSAGARSAASSLNPDPVVSMRVTSSIHSCWKVILQRCRQRDTYRLGEIDAGDFQGILKEVHIQMTPLEFEQLMAKYGVNTDERIRYSDFLRHFVLSHKPAVPRLLRRNILHLTKMPSAEPPSTQCVEAMLRIHGTIHQFWRSLKQSFLAFDKARSRKISVQNFRRVLRLYHINLSEEEFFHITSYFDKDMSGKIYYNEFLGTFLG